MSLEATVDLKPVDISKTDSDVTIEITPSVAGEEIAWTPLDPDDTKLQSAVELIEPVVAYAVIRLDDGTERQHAIYRLKDKFWASGIDAGATPPCADTAEAAQTLITNFYQYGTAFPTPAQIRQAKWDRYHAENDPPE